MFHDFFQLFVVNVAVAFACGGAIGLERQIRGKPAGLRVCLIVVLTSAFFITIGREVTPEGGDPTRVLAAVITGVGFLGAGVIFSQGGKVRGITTASLVWALAAIGAVIGFGHAWVGITATAIIMVGLAIVDWVEWQFPRLRKESDPGKDQL